MTYAVESYPQLAIFSTELDSFRSDQPRELIQSRAKLYLSSEILVPIFYRSFRIMSGSSFTSRIILAVTPSIMQLKVDQKRLFIKKPKIFNHRDYINRFHAQGISTKTHNCNSIKFKRFFWLGFRTLHVIMWPLSTSLFPLPSSDVKIVSSNKLGDLLAVLVIPCNWFQIYVILERVTLLDYSISIVDLNDRKIGSTWVFYSHTCRATSLYLDSLFYNEFKIGNSCPF